MSNNVERRARAFSGANPDETYDEGVIVAYSVVPQYCIRREDGTEFWWRHDLCEVYGEPLTQSEIPSRSVKKAPHFLIMKHSTDVGEEAVCHCGALFKTIQGGLFGTLGELLAAHIRSVRAQEEGAR